MDRRGFLLALGSAPFIGAALAPVFSWWAGHSVVSSPAPAPLPARAKPALPPSVRRVNLACRGCGRIVATAEVDELDGPAEIACGRCYQDKLDQIEEMADNDDFDGRGDRGEYDNLLAEHEDLERDVKRMRAVSDRVADRLYDMSFQARDRPREDLRDLELALRKPLTT